MVDLKEIMTTADCSIKREDPVLKAVAVMKQKKWDIVPVLNGEGKLDGIFTRSTLFDMILENKPLTEPVHQFLKKDAVAVDYRTPFETVKEMVEKSGVGTGVITEEDGRVIGLLRKTDMVMGLLRSSTALKEQLETVLEISHLGVLMTDGDKRIIYANDEFTRMSGQELSSLAGKQLDTLFPDLDCDSIDSLFLSKVNIGNEQAMLRLSSYKTGENSRGLIALLQDISELEQMAQELRTVKNLKQTLDTAIEHAYDGILMVNEEKKVTMVSPPLLDLFSLEKEEVLHRPIEQVLPQLNLCSVFQSGEAELSDFLEVNGIKYIVNKIPVEQDGEIIGALGKVMFRQLNQVSELFNKLEKAEKKAAYYKTQLQQTETARFTWDEIISSDPYVEKLKRSARKAAKGRSTILIRGESGTGKELFAHAIHGSSVRKDGKFVTVNCAAIPEHLLESEFFGYEDGAFTGARQKGKIGKFDLANGGTLFLDEIGDMSLALQAKLLRVLQEREFYRVGGTQRIHVDVRIIAATNRSLEEMVEKGEFREDLYYRLNVISLQITPLRERKADIYLLTDTFIKQLNRMLGTSITGIDKNAEAVMMNYDWPGNVRELKNVLERAMTFAETGKIILEDLPEYMINIKLPAAEEPELKMAESAEKSVIQRALDNAGGNKTKASQLLGISRSGLYEKLKKYQL
ncbi:sigma 54-interacting transcriptional regulator [Evansella sp. LMS18]|uniref:sigma 54-interacting transcriptional regulator n=1 Tax=Evansella sp. LMS18 TaxID=2924033 RepID=UPI0020D19EFA|nr:sigma 54-interacting transcriptional regulator [Evansella sp. LMS18]UTR08916.1 sigma 54-interacting transcriptional regulator [Evansella sp. LMS18]